MNKIVLVSMLALMCALTGCAAGNMQFDSRMSGRVFLDTEKLSDPRTLIFVRASNTSSSADIDFRKLIADQLITRGFKTTKNAKEAAFTLQADLFYVGEEDSSHTFEGAGSPGTIIDGVVKRTAAPVGGSFMGGAGGTLTNTTTVIAVTDMLIEERQGKSLVPVSLTRLVTRVKQFNADKPRMYELLLEKTPAKVAGQFGG